MQSEKWKRMIEPFPQLLRKSSLDVQLHEHKLLSPVGVISIIHHLLTYISPDKGIKTLWEKQFQNLRGCAAVTTTYVNNSGSILFPPNFHRYVF